MFRYATHNRNLKLAAVFYGTGPDAETDIARIHGSVYGFYGGNDNRVNATTPKSTVVSCDGYVELIRWSEFLDPRNPRNTAANWNNDNQPHPETWHNGQLP